MPLPSAYLARCVNTPNEEALRLTYQYLMTAEGSAALAELPLPEAERSALMQRAAEDASFQVRVRVRVRVGVRVRVRVGVRVRVRVS